MEPVAFFGTRADRGKGETDETPPARKPLELASDEVVAARRLHRRVREALETLRRESGLRVAAPSLAEHVRQVVVIASSSRGGSSLLAEMLRSVPGLSHFPGEINPVLRLANLVVPCAPSHSDALGRADLTPTALQEVDHELSAQCGTPALSLVAREDLDRFALHLACRLTMQWPGETFDFHEVRAWMDESLQMTKWRAGEPLDGVAFHVAFLACARRRHPLVDPRRYDLPEEMVGRPHSHAGPPRGPLIEEPPFVAIMPWQSLDAREISARPLVIKTPSNAYRLDALGALFPGATVRVLHLVRNAGASVNGLFDGWRHHGFFAHHLDVPLAIEGYSNLGAWARHQWKFDLPPGWQEFTTAPLLDVCAFQWRSAHQAVLHWLSANPGVDRFRLRFEDLVGPLERRRRAWEALEAWLGTPLLPSLESLIENGLPPIMATQRPSHRRWAARANLLEPILATREMRETMEALGYEPDPRTWD